MFAVHGSSVSLVSTASSLYSTPEEKQAHEIRKLRKELGEAQEKVHTLTSQLSTNVSTTLVVLTGSLSPGCRAPSARYTREGRGK